jgi:fructoselysine-6-P-deglycase FrlB-like protein
LLANAQSAAELLHGPIAMASRDMPAIVLAGDRHSRGSVRGAMARQRGRDPDRPPHLEKSIRTR